MNHARTILKEGVVCVCVCLCVCDAYLHAPSQIFLTETFPYFQFKNVFTDFLISLSKYIVHFNQESFLDSYLLQNAPNYRSRWSDILYIALFDSDYLYFTRDIVKLICIQQLPTGVS